MAEDKDDIERYREGSLSEKERHVLEKKALDDPFLAEALEGSEHISANEFSSDLKLIREKIGRKPSFIWFTPLRIAAGVLLVIGAGSTIYFLNDQEPVTLSMNKKVEESVSPGPANGISKDSSLLSMNQPKETEAGKEVKSPPKSKAKEVEKTLSMDSKTGPVQKENEKTGDVGMVSKSVTEEKPEARTEEVSANDSKTDVTVTPSQALAQGGGASKKATHAFGESAKDDARQILPQNVIGNVIAEDGSPLPGVNVQVKGTQTGTTTDSKGNFSLNVLDKKQALVFSFIGMQSSEVTPNDKTSLNIQLREDASQLSEVVVKGESLSDFNDPIIKMAAPIGGLKAYNQYLENNLRYPRLALDNKVKGRVTIGFTVSTTGSLSDFTVVRGIGSGCDEEVMRLVKEGPRWTPTTQDDVAIESEVKVRMKFDPEKAKK